MTLVLSLFICHGEQSEAILAFLRLLRTKVLAMTTLNQSVMLRQNPIDSSRFTLKNATDALLATTFANARFEPKTRKRWLDKTEHTLLCM